MSVCLSEHAWPEKRMHRVAGPFLSRSLSLVGARPLVASRSLYAARSGRFCPAAHSIKSWSRGTLSSALGASAAGPRLIRCPPIPRLRAARAWSDFPASADAMTAPPKDANPANTSCHVQLLGVGSDTTCTAASALLFFDRARYLFNVGEGFQRFCVQHRVKMSRISSVLLTRLGPEAAGGLPGMLLTLADGAGGAASGGGLLAGVEGVGLDLHGPPGLRNLVGAFKTFVNVGELGLQVHETREEEPKGEGGEEDEHVSKTGDSHPFIAPLVVDTPLVAIHALTLRPSSSVAEPESAAEAGNRKRGRLTEGELVASQASPAPASAYLCRLADVPGRFLPQKAASLGVPRGKAYGQLVRGESVTAANGQTVTPDEVCEPSTPGPVVLVLDCPSMAYFESLRAQPDLERCLSDSVWAARLACVVHLAPEEVVRDKRYASWTLGFGERAPACQHLVAAAGGGARRPPMRSGAQLQLKLHAVDPALFPLQASLAREGKDGLGAPPRAQGLLAPGCATASSGASMLKYHIRPLPKRGLDAAECDAELDVEAELGAVEAEHAEVLAALRADVEAQRASETAQSASAPAHPAPTSRTSCRVIFLGTGAAVPSKYRNVSGTLVDCFERGALLVDCGEGSYGQLQRQLGPAAADAALAQLHAVWISHIHADHHAGLPAILAARARLSPAAEPLLVMAPRSLSRALAAYAGLAPLAFCWVDVDGCRADLDVEESAETSAHAALLRSACERLGLRSLESFVVEHCAHACGLALVSRDGWKLVFSGDTRPCEAVVRAARDATLLVHEATFEDALRDEALAKRHSTAGEALDVAARAGVGRVVLTHFSQRYPKVPTLGGGDGERLAGIAFDLMTLNLADLERLPLLVRPLQTILADPEDVEAEE